MKTIEDALAEIEAQAEASGIPTDARTDWDGTNHYEIQTASADGYWWLICSEVFGQRTGDPSATEAGKRLGAVLDLAVASRVNVPRLCRALRACMRAGLTTETYREIHTILTGEDKS